MNHHHHRPVEKAGKRRRVIDYIGGIAVVGFVVLLFSLVIIDLVQNWKVREWPYAEATLVDRSLTVVNRSESSKNPAIYYQINYVFSYAWQGRTYYHRERAFSSMRGSDRAFWEFSNPIGTKKTVRLNPDNPTEATLKWGVSWAYDVMVGSFAIGWLVVGLLWLYRPARQTKDDRYSRSPRPW